MRAAFFSPLGRAWKKFCFYFRDKLLFPVTSRIVCSQLESKRFHDYMLRKQGRSWLNYLQRVSNPLESLSMISHYEGFDVPETFSQVYQNNSWGDSESKSGPGSRLEETKAVRAVLPELLRRYEVRDFVDIPCGDWNWMKTVDLDSLCYHGGDIVPELIEENRKKFGGGNRSFEVIDLIAGPLPAGDLLLCRDCLVHLSFQDIGRFLEHLHRSGLRYLLTTTFTDRKSNDDIVTGNWRRINLEIAPFHFPEPLERIVEGSTERRNKDSDKCLALWEVGQLPKQLHGRG